MDKKEVTIENLIPHVEENLERDGYLLPVVFIINEEQASIMDISEYMEEDSSKDELALLLQEVAEETKAYKLIMVSEAWAYKAPEGMAKEEFSKLSSTAEYRDKFTRSEIYQISDIQKKSVNIYTKQFTRDGDKIIFGEGELNSDAQTPRYKEVQDSLINLN